MKSELLDTGQHVPSPSVELPEFAVVSIVFGFEFIHSVDSSSQSEFRTRSVDRQIVACYSV